MQGARTSELAVAVPGTNTIIEALHSQSKLRPKYFCSSRVVMNSKKTIRYCFGKTSIKKNLVRYSIMIVRTKVGLTVSYPGQYSGYKARDLRFESW